MRGTFMTLGVVFCVVSSAPAQAVKPGSESPASKQEKSDDAETRPKAVVPEFHEGTEARHLHMNEVSKAGKAKLVFLGDSITEGWEGTGKSVWKEHFEKHEAANFGISGDRTEHVLWRLEHGNLDGLKPRCVVIMIGTNNTGHRQDKPEETAAGVKAIVQKVQAKCPDAKILLLAIFPRGEKADDPLRKINDGVNAIIRKLGDGKRVFFKDIGENFVEKDGTLKREIMPDLLHLNAKGYAAWAAAIKDDVEKLMRD